MSVMVTVNLDYLAAFRATMPWLRRPSVELLREARDEGALGARQLIYFNTSFLAPLIVP
jgi:hypothetical protein